MLHRAQSDVRFVDLGYLGHLDKCCEIWSILGPSGHFFHFFFANLKSTMIFLLDRSISTKSKNEPKSTDFGLRKVMPYFVSRRLLIDRSPGGAIPIVYDDRDGRRRAACDGVRQRATTPPT